MSVSYYPLFTQTVGAGGAATINFANIPQGYQDLRIEFSLRSNAAAGTADGNIITVNNSAYPSSIYSWTQVYSTGAGVGGNNYVTGSYMGVVNASTATAGIFTVGSVDIPAYSGGAYKSAFVDSTSENGGGSPYTAQFISNSIRTTAPITSLTITCGNGSFVQYSTVTIYVRAAQYQAALPVSPSNPAVTDQAGFASVSFTPSSSDNASIYAVTDSNAVTTYGAYSPIVAPLTVGTSTTYTVKAINALGSSQTAATSSITTSNAFASIGTVYASSGTIASANFYNIPQNYSHLQIRAFTRGGATTFSAGLTLYLSFNGDGTTSLYSYHGLYGDGSGTYSGGVTSSGVIAAQQALPDFSATSGYFGVAVIDIYDYTSTTKGKTVKYLSGYDKNGGGRAQQYSGAWSSTAPITGIQVNTDGVLAQFSHIALYGIA
jgi:hypothetical protein